jgi:hypothetical protein
MTDPLVLIEKGCYLCLRFMLQPSFTATDCLEVREGFYGQGFQGVQLLR